MQFCMVSPLNEMSLAVLSHGVICYRIKFKKIWDLLLTFLLWPLLGVKGLNGLRPGNFYV